MDLFRRRPMFVCCSVFMLAAIAGFFLPLWGKLIGGGVALAATLLFCAVGKRKGFQWRRTVGIVACALAILALLQSHLWFCGGIAKEGDAHEGQPVTVSGVITDRRGSGGYMTSYTLDLTEMNGRDVGGTALLTCHYVSDLQPGMAISVHATVISLSEAAGDGYDGVALLGDGYRLGLLSESEKNVTVTSESVLHPKVAAGKLRRTLASRLELLTEGGEGLPSALLLGERGYLDDAVRRDYARAGASHLLAISGLHMTLLFGMLGGLLALLRIPKRLRAWILGGAVFSYLLLLGFPPSATRAAIMLGMTYLSYLLSSRPDPLTSLGLAGALILLVTPFSVADGGFWMSYLATLGILAVMPLVGERKRDASDKISLWRMGLRACGKIAVGILVGVMATAATLPVVALVIGETSLLSPVTTLLLTPLCGGILILSIASLLLLWTPLGGLFGSLAALLCRLSLEVAALLGSPAEAVVSLRYPFVIGAVIACFVALMILLAVSLPRRWRWVTVTPVAAAWLSIWLFPTAACGMHPGRVEVSYRQPSSQSEAIVLVSGRESVICDLSNGSLTAMSAAVREAEELYATEVSVLMLTHYHSRTAGALNAILNRETVRALWCPEPSDETDYYLLLACMEQAELAGVPLYLYAPEETLGIFDDGTVTMYTAALSRSIQPVILLSYSIPTGEDDHRLLYCGGATFESELKGTAATLADDAQTVIFGSHGPAIHEPFGGEVTFTHTDTVIFSACGDVGAWFETKSLPCDVKLWLGEKRRLTAESK